MAGWITAIVGAHLARAVTAVGGDGKVVAAELGLGDTPAFEDRISLEDFIAAWERAITDTGKRDLPVLAAPRSNHDERSLVGFCAANQPTIGGALDTLDRYMGTISDSYAWRVFDHEDKIHLCVQPIGPVNRLGWQLYLEYESLDIVGIARRLTRGRANPIAARYVHGAPPPAVVESMHRALGVTPEFDAEVCELVYPRSIRDLVIEGARAQLAELVRDRLEALLREREASVAARARMRIPDLLRRGTATVDALAKVLAMSRRSFERALAAEGTSAAALVDEARLALALAWLPRITVDEVATRLGYSDARAFARAFRRWTGKPPSAVSS